MSSYDAQLSHSVFLLIMLDIPAGLNIIYFSIMKKDNAVILPSGQVSQRVIFPSFLHLSSLLQAKLALDPQAVDADAPFCCDARCPPLSCIKFGSENPGLQKGEAEMGVYPSELAPVVQCHRCGRGKPVHIPAHHRGPSLGMGSVQIVIYAEVYNTA